MHDKMRVLFATDFSPSSRVALQTARLFCEVYHAKISLIHVLTHFWRYFISSGLYEKEAMERLKTWQQSIYPNKKDENDLQVVMGNAADMILQQAEKDEPDLILLGGDSETSKEKFITGTTAEAVIRHAKQSVWLTKKNTINKILCGIDGSDASAKAVKEAVEICRKFSAELCIIHSIPQLEFNPLGMTDAQVKHYEDTFKEERIARISNFLEQFDFSNLNLRRQFSWGTPARVILDMAVDFEFDVIVVGATGESMLKQILMGSTTERILRHTPCSLYIVR